jgi:hypothetical protein
MKTQMKNTIITASFLLLSTISYGQTKEETISWLTEKFNKSLEPVYGFSADKITNIKISPCEIVINAEHHNAYGELSETYEITIPTDGTIVEDENIKFTEERILIKYLEINKNFYYKGITGYCKLKNSEPDLYARVKKALDHLATFCPKKKETF